MPYFRVFVPLLLSLSFGCQGCQEEESSTQEGAKAATSKEEGEIPEVVDGYKVIGSKRSKHLAILKEQEQRKLEKEKAKWVLTPNQPDPHKGSFTLEEAVQGLAPATEGTLVAEINTTFGTMLCDLHGDKVPNTVANFIGLATGKRAWWDARAGMWRQNTPLYKGTEFHRVLPEFGIQGGDHLGDGSGEVGYRLEHEPHPALQHDKRGTLCMASFEDSKDPNTKYNGGQFFILDGPVPSLDTEKGSTVFGFCHNEDVINQIARVPQAGENRPRTPVRITNVRIRRVRGGAESAKPTPPKMPEGFDPENPETGSSIKTRKTPIPRDSHHGHNH